MKAKILKVNIVLVMFFLTISCVKKKAAMTTEELIKSDTSHLFFRGTINGERFDLLNPYNADSVIGKVKSEAGCYNYYGEYKYSLKSSTLKFGYSFSCQIWNVTDIDALKLAINNYKNFFIERNGKMYNCTFLEKNKFYIKSLRNKNFGYYKGNASFFNSDDSSTITINDAHFNFRFKITEK